MKQKLIRPIRCENLSLQVHYEGTTYKVLRLGFLNSDASFWLTCPYFKDSRGRVGSITFLQNQVHKSASLNDSAKVTAHNVKYSHHRSGWAQFSLTGRIRPEIRKMAVPLSELHGQVFVAYFSGLDGFETNEEWVEDAEWKTPRRKRTLTLEAKGANAVWEIVGRLFDKADLGRMTEDEFIGPIAYFPNGDSLDSGIIVSGMPGKPSEHLYLLLTFSKATFSIPDSLPQASFIFLGGFDADEVRKDSTQSTELLFMQYPADIDVLRQLLGSVDEPQVRAQGSSTLN